MKTPLLDAISQKFSPYLGLDPAGLDEIMAQLDRPACCDRRADLDDQAAILARGGSVTILED